MHNDENLMHAGCVPGAVAADAGCAQATGDDGQAAAPPPARPASAGCAAAPASDDITAKPTPPQTVREFERALRALGFNRQAAASIARQGFHGMTADEAGPSESDQLRDALLQLAHTFKESTS